MLKTAPTYKVHVFILMAFFFGLTLGLTLNLIGSQTTDSRSQAASTGQLRNYYCSLSRNELDERFLKQCNGVIGSQGFYGWQVVSDSHSYNGTQDGASNNNLNRETTVNIGSSITINKPEAQLPNPQTWVKNTRCSAVQHDGDGAENGDVFMQYVVDENNYCVIYHNDYQGKTQKLNRCKLQNLNGGALTYWDNDQASNHPDYQPLNKLKEMYQQKCTPKPTANFNTTCKPGQTYGNLSYKMDITNIVPADKFEKNQWFMCMKPGTNNADGYVYTYYFGNKATWKSGANGTNGLPLDACYKIGDDNTYLRPGNNYISYDFDSSHDLDYGNGTDKKDINHMANWITSAINIGEMTNSTTFRTKINLWANGQFNDQIVAPGYIKIQKDACIQPTSLPTNTPRPTQTPVPTATTPPQACTYTEEVHTLDKGKYIANIINNNGDFTNYTHNIDLKKVDISKPIKVVADWGWTGKIAGNKPQKGKIVLPGQNVAADEFWQRNETSSMTFSVVKPNNTLRNLLQLTCNDVGEKMNGDQTPFVDGRRVTYNNVARNLNDVYPDEPGETQGNYFFCPQSASAGWPVAVVDPKNRNDYQYSSTTLTNADYYNTATKLVRLQIKRQFQGSSTRSGASIQSTDNAKTAGSHYTRATISYCQLP